MGGQDQPGRPSARQLFDETQSGARPRPFLPRLRSDPPAYQPIPHSLREFRAQEGADRRQRRLRELWQRLPKRSSGDGGDGAGAVAGGSGGGQEHDEAVARAYPVHSDGDLSAESARQLGEMYEDELLGRCGAPTRGPFSRRVSWAEFEKYADAKETELWHIFHDELDLDGNGHLDTEELELALEKAGIKLSASTLSEFITFLTSSPHSHAISFKEFRDFLLLMPRKASAEEIFRYYKVRKFLGDDGRGPARVNMEGDVTLSAEDLSLDSPATTPVSKDTPPVPVDHRSPYDAEDEDEEFEEYEEEEPHHSWLGGSTAVRFLLAGGVAGAVSRTCTAPFDRLKIFLITRPPELGGTSLTPQAPVRGLKAIGGAIARIYAEGGVLAFWTGNGLSVAKILPESAIKFLTYESSKRMFAKYVDKVDDPRDISGVSRFLSGGMGGICSQLTIYPIETLKTQMMSSAGGQKRSLREAAQRVWQLGGMRAFYRGLTIGLIGVFPYSAIDMSTFEALKLAYLRSTGKDEPGVLALLAFGSVSGSVGATSVYPLNLVRTRLQASGSSGHPERYTGMFDVVKKTYTRDGWRGFYRGLLPTLAKVVPAVSISYVVYESSKRKLGV
ncbi:mitochondrial carrier [Trametes maxima]|nr:mitochondrial carrier [Trametes maxima]